MFKPRFAHKSGGRLAIPGLAVTALTGGYFYYRSPSNNATTGGQVERSRQKRDKEALKGAGIGNNATSGGHETGQVGSGIQPATGDVERGFATTAESRNKLPSGGVGGGAGSGGTSTRTVEMSGKKSLKNGFDENFKSPSASPAHLDSVDASDSKNNFSTNPADAASSSDQKATQRSGARGDGNPGIEDQSVDHKVTSSTYPASTRDQVTKTKSGSTEEPTVSQRLQGVFGQGGGASGEPGQVPKTFDNPKVMSNHGEAPTKRGQLRSDS